MSVMDVDGVFNCLKKLECLKKEQEVIISDIKNIRFNDFYSNDFYNSFVNQISNNLDVIIGIHNKNILYVDTKKNEYINMSKISADKFRNLGE